MAKIFTPYDFYMFASVQMRELQRSYAARKAVGIYRREFHWIPNQGKDSINRRISGCNRLGDVGIKKLHFLESVGRAGYVGIRERSCHQCSACIRGEFTQCKNSARCGHYRILQLSPKTAVPRASTRLHRENGAIAFAEACSPGDFFIVDQIVDSTAKFVIFAVAKDSMLRIADEGISAYACHLLVREGHYVIDGMRFTCVSPGGTVFAPTRVEVVVPVSSILSFGMELKKLEPLRTMRTAVDKWQLSSEGHARTLKLLSTSLDEEVAEAVTNVSGRS